MFFLHAFFLRVCLTCFYLLVTHQLTHTITTHTGGAFFFFDRALVGAVKATRLFGLPLIIALGCFGLVQLDEECGDIK